MKYILSIFVIFITILFTSCSSIPKPYYDDDVLIIGKFRFLISNDEHNKIQTQLNDRIYVHIEKENDSDDWDLPNTHYNGYFYFVGSADTEYKISKFWSYFPSDIDIDGDGEADDLGISSPANFKFKTKNDKIAYIGDILITYYGNGFIKQVFTFDKVVEESSAKITYDVPGVKAFLEEKDSKNRWPKNQIIPVKIYTDNR